MIELNHAAALAMVDGPAAALQRVEALDARGALAGYDVLPAVRADLLRRLGRTEEARAAYRTALALARHEPDRRFFQRRIAELERIERQGNHEAHEAHEGRAAARRPIP